MTESMENKTKAMLHTTIIQTTQMAELAEFYRRGLELNPASVVHDNHLGFPFPNVYFGFDLVDKVPGEYPGAVSLWFEVDDLEVAFNRFVELGAAIKYKPTKKPWGALLAAVFDPDGNVIGLAQRGTNPH